MFYVDGKLNYVDGKLYIYFNTFLNTVSKYSVCIMCASTVSG